MVVASTSPVSLDEFLQMIDGVLGLPLTAAEGQRLLQVMMTRRPVFPIGSYRFRLEVIDAFNCWLHSGEGAGGLYLCLCNTEHGVLIHGIRDLGGGRRCGSFTLNT